MFPLPASAAPLLPVLSASELLRPAARFSMQRSPDAAASAMVYAFARAGETPAELAAAYGMDPAALTVDPHTRLRAGAVVPLKVWAARPGRRLPPGVLSHIVRPGDTIGALALRYGLSTQELLSANLKIQSLDRLAVGSEVLIPTRERGLLVAVTAGQNLLDLSRAHHADPLRVARVNDLSSPTELRAGDYLLLPGVQAKSLMAELLAQRERARLAARQQAVQNQYERFLAYRQQVAHQKALAAQKVQQQYERYQAYLKSPQRRALEAQYARQAQYQKFVAQQVEAQKQREAQARQAQARQAAAARTPTLRQAAFGAAGIIWPMRSYRLTSRFGERDIEFHKEFFHGGVDLAAPSGTPIRAATDGVVQESGYGDFGLNVWVSDGDATIIYGHMSRAAVQAGQQVQQGQVIGYVGCTGFCTGPHLHFEVRLQGRAVDPLGLLP